MVKVLRCVGQVFIIFGVVGAWNMLPGLAADAREAHLRSCQIDM